MRLKAKVKEIKTSSQRQTVSGSMVTLSDEENKAFAGKKICSGGQASNSLHHKPHKWRFWRRVVVYLGETTRQYQLEKDEGGALCRCQYCGAYLGCWQCVGLVQEMNCRSCKKPGNKFAEM